MEVLAVAASSVCWPLFSYEAMGDTRETVYCSWSLPADYFCICIMVFGPLSLSLSLVLSACRVGRRRCIRTHRHNPSHSRTENPKKVLGSRLSVLSSMSATVDGQTN